MLRAFLFVGPVLVAAGSPLAAQSYEMDRGVWLLGGSAQFARATHGDNTTTNLALSLTAGRFLAPGLALSASGYVSHSRDSLSSYTTYGFGPRIAYYFGRRPGQVHPYLAASGQYTTASGPNQSTFGFTGSGGVAVLIVRNVAITSELFYTRTQLTSNPWRVPPTTVVGTRFGLSLFFY